MYPLKFKKCFVKKIWGGRAFEDSLGMKLPIDSLYGESWEVSSHPKEMSYVENGVLRGKSFQELLHEDSGILLGEGVKKRFNGNFPLLIKYLDINDKLSVQVHPSDEYALKIEKEFGKAESWYIIEASNDAKLIMGMKEGITKNEFSKKAKERDFTDIFNIVSVKKGDFIDIKPGLVHASLEGSIVVCEIQQNSDTTYRIYDFDRSVNGEARELHLDKAADVINFDIKPEITTNDSRRVSKLVGAIKEELIRCDYFNIDKLTVNGIFKDVINSNFKIYSILEGEGTIVHSEIEYKIKRGDTYFIPASLDVSIKGNIEMLKSFL